jgi:hypothetical protein
MISNPADARLTHIREGNRCSLPTFTNLRLTFRLWTNLYITFVTLRGLCCAESEISALRATEG